MNKEKKKEIEHDWYFTFGYGQRPGIGYFTKFYGTYSSAREELVKYFNTAFSFQYPSAESCGVEEYKLLEIDIEELFQKEKQKNKRNK